MRSWLAAVPEIARETWATIAIRARRTPPAIWAVWIGAAVMVVAGLFAVSWLGDGPERASLAEPGFGFPSQGSGPTSQPDVRDEAEDPAGAPAPAPPAEPAVVGQLDEPDAPGAEAPTDPDGAGGSPSAEQPDSGGASPPAGTTGEAQTTTPTQRPGTTRPSTTTRPNTTTRPSTTTTQPPPDEDSGDILGDLIDLLTGRP